MAWPPFDSHFVIITGDITCSLVVLGGDVIIRHNQLRDCIADVCHKACLSPLVEKGSGILIKTNPDLQTF